MEWTLADGECFKFVPTYYAGYYKDGLTHSQAEAICFGMGAQLGTIRAQAQNQAVASMVGNCSEVHNGLNIDEQSSQLAWQSGKPVICQGDYCRLTPAAGWVRLTPAAGWQREQQDAGSHYGSYRRSHRGSHHRTHSSSQRGSHHRSRSPYRGSDGGAPTWAWERGEKERGERGRKRGGKVRKKWRKKMRKKMRRW